MINFNSKPVDVKSITLDKNSWDNIALHRYSLTKNGDDISFDYVLKPCILNSVKSLDKSNVLDVGCGTGILTRELAQVSTKVVGIDHNKISIDYAKQFEYSRNIEYYDISIIHYSKINTIKFDLCVSNMVLMDLVDLDQNLKAIYNTLKPNGNFVFTITHPCFWSMYQQYINQSWFQYNRVSAIESDFKLSMSETLGRSIHIHRPLEVYINSLLTANFSIKQIIEPFPILPIKDLKGYEYNYPRFMCIIAGK
jgi:SAM-dependent methyltransferase